LRVSENRGLKSLCVRGFSPLRLTPSELNVCTKSSRAKLILICRSVGPVLLNMKLKSKLIGFLKKTCSESRARRWKKDLSKNYDFSLNMFQCCEYLTNYKQRWLLHNGISCDNRSCMMVTGKTIFNFMYCLSRFEDSLILASSCNVRLSSVGGRIALWVGKLICICNSRRSAVCGPKTTEVYKVKKNVFVKLRIGEHLPAFVYFRLLTLVREPG
jgi:hypothetical protein